MTTALNEEQRHAVRAPVGPVLVPAAPGSGKTRVAAERIVWLISELHVDPASIVAFTFTNRAARELRERIGARLTPAEADALFAGTFHSWGARFLRRYHREAGLEQNFTIYDQDDSLELVKRAIQDLDLPAENTTAEAREYLRHVSRAKNDDKSPDDTLRRWAHTLDRPQPPQQAVRALVHRRYRELLFENGAVDFDDLIVMPLRILQQDPEVQAEVRARVKHVVVDEYQDTSRSQHLLVAALLDYPRDPRPSIYAVGDPDQAIYSFRNADVDNIVQFRETHYQEARERQLRTNYRSSPQIVNAAQSLIEHNERRLERSSNPASPDGPPLDWMQTNNPDHEAKAIAAHIKSLKDADRFPLQECCIVYRTNPQSRALEEALRAEAIPYQVTGNYEFFARAEIKRVTDYLALAVNPLDATRLRRIANLPPRGLGPRSMAVVENYAQEREIQLRSAVAELAQAPEPHLSAAAAQGIKQLDHHLTQLATMAGGRAPTAAIIQYVNQECGLVEHYTKQTDGANRVPNIMELLSIAQSLTGVNLRQFLERTAISPEGERAAADRVTLATIHQTKGLEFDVVYLAGAEEGLIPHRRAMHTADDVEEERRLMYVAMTRARRRLIISWTRFRSQEKQEIRRSRFVDEIDPQAWSKPLPSTRRS